MSYDKKFALVDAMVAKTNSGELVWEATFDDDMFETTLKSSSIRIMKNNNRFIITVLGKDGAVLERFNNDDLGLQRPQYEDIVKNIYEVIRRKALKVDETIDALLDELKS